MGLAARAGLDVAAAERALADGRHQVRLADDAAWAARLGAAGAPALAWNGAVSGLPAAPSVWEEAWQDAARRARAVDATGVAPARRYATLVRGELTRRADAAWRRGLPDGAQPAARLNVPTEGAPALEPPGARALLVAFGDYTSNASRALARDLHQLDSEYPGALKIVWKHAPAARPDAQAAARAAACAQRQDQFWELHRRLIAYHYRVGREELVDLAAATGLALDRFVDDFDGGACEARVEDDLADARALGVEPGSFALFINGRRVPGEYSGAAVRAILDDELAPGDLAALSAP
jgi:predicted DsbA family dithiol-disulfide isomerase